jgi:hypothetical protein
MRPVQFILTVVFASGVVFLCMADAQAGVAAWRRQSGEKGEMSCAGGSQWVTQARRVRTEPKLQESQPPSGHGSSGPFFPSRTGIVAAVCSGLALAVSGAVVVSAIGSAANSKARHPRSQREFKARTWVELTQSPQF